jgi:hypothetical protein
LAYPTTRISMKRECPPAQDLKLGAASGRMLGAMHPFRFMRRGYAGTIVFCEPVRSVRIAVQRIHHRRALRCAALRHRGWGVVFRLRALYVRLDGFLHHRRLGGGSALAAWVDLCNGRAWNVVRGGRFGIIGVRRRTGSIRVTFNDCGTVRDGHRARWAAGRLRECGYC